MWLIIGLVVGAALVGLVMWLRGNDVKVAWYEWCVGGIGLLLLLFTILNFAGSFAVTEPTAAAWMFLLVTGLPALILLVLAWQLVARRQRAGS